MIPLLINGIFLAVLVFLRKLGKSSDTWVDKREQEKFRQEREKWIDERVLLDTFR
jgi:hypothetical protein